MSTESTNQSPPLDSVPLHPMVGRPRCALCGAICNRCDQENRNEQDEVDEPDFTLDDLEWSEEYE